eukprot:4732306-Pyramimonas_sp.AAC.1
MACMEGEYTWIRDQWRVWRGSIPGSGTNGVYGGGVYLDQGPMACIEGEYPVQTSGRVVLAASVQ